MRCRKRNILLKEKSGAQSHERSVVRQDQARAQCYSRDVFSVLLQRLDIETDLLLRKILHRVKIKDVVRSARGLVRVAEARHVVAPV